MKNFQPAQRTTIFHEYIFSRLSKAVDAVELGTGRKVLNFGAGTPDVRPSPRFTAKLAELVADPEAHAYPGYGPTKEFTAALQGWYKLRFQVELTEHELLQLNGAKDGISHLPLALLDEGDEILIPDPGYPPFSDPALMIGARPVTYSLSAGNAFKIDLNELQTKVTDRTKYMWVNFPSNPTGQVATLAELEALVSFARQHNLFILYDNAYAEITFEGFVAPSILQVPEAKEVAVEIGSFSKSHSFAGFRMGWIVGNRAVIAALAKVKTQIDSGMSLPLQGLGAYALTNPDEEWRQAMISSYKQRRDNIAPYLTSLGLKFTLPKSSLYIWARIPDAAESSETFCLQLLKNKQILMTPGTAFGKNGERYVRVSICVNVDKIGNYF